MKYKVKEDILVCSGELLYRATIPAGSIIELEEVEENNNNIEQDNIQECIHGTFSGRSSGIPTCPYGCLANKN